MSLSDYSTSVIPYDSINNLYADTMMKLMVDQQKLQANPPLIQYDRDTFKKMDYKLGFDLAGTYTDSISGYSPPTPNDVCPCNLCRSYRNPGVSIPPDSYNPIPIERRYLYNEYNDSINAFRVYKDAITGRTWKEIVKKPVSANIQSTPLGNNPYYEMWKEEQREVRPLGKVADDFNETYSKKVRKLFWARKHKLLDRNKKDGTQNLDTH